MDTSANQLGWDDWSARTLPGLDLGALRVLEVSSDVANEVVPVDIAEDLLPEHTGLLEVDCKGEPTSVN